MFVRVLNANMIAQISHQLAAANLTVLAASTALCHLTIALFTLAAR